MGEAGASVVSIALRNPDCEGRSCDTLSASGYALHFSFFLMHFVHQEQVNQPHGDSENLPESGPYRRGVVSFVG